MQWYLFRLTPAARSWLSPIPDGWHLQNKMVGLIPWVSELWSVVAELLYILQCMVPCRCTTVVIWKVPVWCLTFRVYPNCVLHQRADQWYMWQPVLPTKWWLGTALFPIKISVSLHPSPPFWFGERKSLTKNLSNYLSLIRQWCHIAGEVGGISIW